MMPLLSKMRSPRELIECGNPTVDIVLTEKNILFCGMLLLEAVSPSVSA